MLSYPFRSGIILYRLYRKATDKIFFASQKIFFINSTNFGNVHCKVFLITQIKFLVVNLFQHHKPQERYLFNLDSFFWPRFFFFFFFWPRYFFYLTLKFFFDISFFVWSSWKLIQKSVKIVQNSKSFFPLEPKLHFFQVFQILINEKVFLQFFVCLLSKVYLTCENKTYYQNCSCKSFLVSFFL